MDFAIGDVVVFITIDELKRIFTTTSDGDVYKNEPYYQSFLVAQKDNYHFFGREHTISALFEDHFFTEEGGSWCFPYEAVKCLKIEEEEDNYRGSQTVSLDFLEI